MANTEDTQRHEKQPAKLLQVLHVEDNPFDAELFREQLADSAIHAYELTHVERLHKALDLIHERQIDVIFLDFVLPDSGNGLQSMARIREISPKVPIIMLTGHDDDATGIEAVVQGAQDYLVKGLVDFRTLWRVVRYAIERKKIEEHLEERRRLEVRLQQTQRVESLEALAGGIAHQFNNMLTTILGNSHLALGELTPDASSRMLIEDISVAAGRATHLTSQLLSYSGRGTYQMTSVELSDFLKSMEDLIAAAVPHSVSVMWDFAEEPVSVTADESQLRQVMLSLLSNAVEAMQDKRGTITLSTSTVAVGDPTAFEQSHMCNNIPTGMYACLSVSDNGVGMTPDTVEKVFDPFFTTKFTGRGLGLASVAGIVRAHHGTVKVDSHPSFGTKLSIFLPLLRTKSRLSDARADENLGELRVSGTLLVMDEEKMIVSINQKILQRQGYKVVTALDTESCLRLLQENAPDTQLVILGQQASELARQSIAAQMRRMQPNLRIIACTDLPEDEAEQILAGLGFDGFLQKPYMPDALLAKIHQVLAES